MVRVVAADFGVGVTPGARVGAGVTLGANVGEGVAVRVTCHIHECVSDNPVVVLVAIADTFQDPITALVFV